MGGTRSAFTKDRRGERARCVSDGRFIRSSISPKSIDLKLDRGKPVANFRALAGEGILIDVIGQAQVEQAILLGDDPRFLTLYRVPSVLANHVLAQANEQALLRISWPKNTRLVHREELGGRERNPSIPVYTYPTFSAPSAANLLFFSTPSAPSAVNDLELKVLC